MRDVPATSLDPLFLSTSPGGPRLLSLPTLTFILNWMESHSLCPPGCGFPRHYSRNLKGKRGGGHHGDIDVLFSACMQRSDHRAPEMKGATRSTGCDPTATHPTRTHPLEPTPVEPPTRTHPLQPTPLRTHPTATHWDLTSLELILRDQRRASYSSYGFCYRVRSVKKKNRGQKNTPNF